MSFSTTPDMPCATDAALPFPMTDPVIDFAHRQTTHCESGAAANMLRHHGLDLSEPLVFGIGGGLFFGYFPFLRMAHIRVTTFRKAPGAVFNKAMQRLGVPYRTETFFSKANARSKMDTLLEAGTPVGLQVGFFWLPYVPRAMRSHFNAHNLVVYGRRKDTYLISEPGLETVQECDAASLERARFSKGGMNPRGRMYWITEKQIPRRPDLREPIRKGLLDTCHSMLDIPIPILGVRGIHYQARDLRKWGRQLPEAQFRHNLNQLLIMQEVVGSGGAGFRFMFAAFLQDAGLALDNAALAAASQRMTAIGDQWRQFALASTRIIKGRANPGETVDALADNLASIAEAEKAEYIRLRILAKELKP